MRAPMANARRGLLKAVAYALENTEGVGLSRVECDAVEQWLRSELPQATNGETLRYWRKQAREAVRRA